MFTKLKLVRDKWFVTDRQTDRPTDRQTNNATYRPPGGGKKYKGENYSSQRCPNI